MHFIIALSKTPYYPMIQTEKRPFCLLKKNYYIGFVYICYPARANLLKYVILGHIDKEEEINIYENRGSK